MPTESATGAPPDAMAKRLEKAIGAEAVERIARQCGLTKRLREIAPLGLLVALVSTLGAGVTHWIADILRTFNAFTGKSVRYKPFHNQLRKSAFPDFVRIVLEEVLTNFTRPILHGLPAGKLATFSDIRIHDGTSFAVKDCLRDHWPGRFSKVSPAAVELHVTMSVLEDSLIHVVLTPDKESEQNFAPDPSEQEGVLCLHDRGYQDRMKFRAMQDAGGFYITRGTKAIRPTIRRAHDLRRRRSRRLRHLEGKRLTWEALPCETVDLDIEWTCKDGVLYHGRLIAIYRPDKRNSKTFVYLHTNLDRETFCAHDVGQLYRLRWQIELMFKEWKSHASLHGFDTSKPAIAEGLIWASLLAAVLNRVVTHAAELALGVELSTQRAAAASRHFFDAVLRGLLAGSARAVAGALAKAFAYLNGNGRRAHPKRDRERGRLSSGLRPIAIA